MAWRCALELFFYLYGWVHTVFEGLWKFGKNGISFSRPWKSVKTVWSLWRFVNFVVFRALGKTISLLVRNCISQDQTVVFFKHAKSQRTHFLSVLTDRVHRPSVRDAPHYSMCRRVAYLCIAFPRHIVGIMPDFLRFVKSLWILKGFFCTNCAFIQKPQGQGLAVAIHKGLVSTVANDATTLGIWGIIFIYKNRSDQK